ncbi:MAG: endonuclease-8, partial [Myxococcota bacterium]
MPEGDTLYVVAERLRPYLVGQPLIGAAVRLGRGKRFGPPKGLLREVPRLVGCVVDAVVPRGKHLIIEMGPFAMRVHLGMSGSWHRYPRGGPWRENPWRVGALLRTETDEVVCFSPPTVALGRRQDILSELLHLGPDLLVDPVDWDAIVANTRVNSERAIADVLLDQRVAAGVGNVYKNEVMFLQRLDPARPVSTLSDGQVRAVWQLASQLMRE